VQDVTEGSPGDQAGIRAYDLITGVEGQPVRSNDELIRMVASMTPGRNVRLDVVRDGHPIGVVVTLAERPGRSLEGRDGDAERPTSDREADAAPSLGVAVRELDRSDLTQLGLPASVHGVIISRVEPLSPAFDASLARGQLILEVNRRPVASAADFRRMVDGAHAGDVLTFYLYLPDQAQRAIRTVRVDRP
jgi:serine protease Do